jgi:hypothetical protein
MLVYGEFGGVQILTFDGVFRSRNDDMLTRSIVSGVAGDIDTKLKVVPTLHLLGKELG